MPTDSNGFGTFAGVFTPSILTILGVVMYLRVGWATGQVGLVGMLVIVLISHLISIATGLSVSSIATNRTVGVGGAYYMVSRALGAPVGGAVGIPLFFAQALSVTFYIVGFTESVLHLMPAEFQTWSVGAAISTIVNIILTSVSLKSAELAIKTQYFVMAAIGLSLLAFFTGTREAFPQEPVVFNADGASFSEVFAVFFPAVTGIMAGVSMSGDLREPRTAIPVGTMSAVFVGLVIYLAVPVWLAFNATGEELISNTSIFFEIASLPPLIYGGIWGATLSSALGSILTAPRTMQALSLDGLMPEFLGKGYGVNREPRIGTLVTFGLAQIGILLGSLDAIAPVLTMFFLVTYGVTNLACGLEKWAANPSFRPSFQVPAPVSLAGGVACFYVMSIIDLPAMVAAMVFCGAIFLYVSRRTLGTTWGDARHGMWAALVRTALLALRRAAFHPQNWRPNMILLGGNPDKRGYLLQLGSAIVQDRGIVTYFHLLRGNVAELAAERKDLLESYERETAEDYPNVFYRVDVVEDIYRGVVQVSQSYGMGSFEANSVMLGWPKKVERGEDYVHMLRDLVKLDRSLLLVKHDDDSGADVCKRIHIWWGGLKGNGGLMLLLAYLITNHHRWRSANVEVLTVVKDSNNVTSAERNLRRLLASARLNATASVIPRNGREIPEIMSEHSKDADLAIVGIRLPQVGESVTPFYERMNTILEGLPTTILVHSARTFEGEPVLFDEPQKRSGG